MGIEGLSTVEILTQMLESWGPNGEHWCKGLRSHDGDKYCVLGAIGKLEDGYPEYPHTLTGHKITALLGGKCNIMYTNDHLARSFQDIKAFICKAIKTELEKEGARLAE